MRTKLLRGFVATSDSLPAYGGVALPDSAMETIAAAIRSGRIPINVNHDEKFRVTPTVSRAEVRRTPRGSFGVWVEVEVDEREYEQYKDLIRGFSISVIANPFEPEIEDRTKPKITISADAAQFSQADFEASVEELRAYFSVGGGRLLQFSLIAEAKVVIDLTIATLQAVPPHLISSVLYDTLRSHFLHPRHAAESVLNFNVTMGADGQKVECQLRTSDAELLRHALQELRQTASSQTESGFLEFDRSIREWKKLR